MLGFSEIPMLTSSLQLSAKTVVQKQMDNLLKQQIKQTANTITKPVA